LALFSLDSPCNVRSVCHHPSEQAKQPLPFQLLQEETRDFGPFTSLFCCDEDVSKRFISDESSFDAPQSSNMVPREALRARLDSQMTPEDDGCEEVVTTCSPHAEGLLAFATIFSLDSPCNVRSAFGQQPELTKHAMPLQVDDEENRRPAPFTALSLFFSSDDTDNKRGVFGQPTRVLAKPQLPFQALEEETVALSLEALQLTLPTLLASPPTLRCRAPGQTCCASRPGDANKWWHRARGARQRGILGMQRSEKAEIAGSLWEERTKNVFTSSRCGGRQQAPFTI
jgi:hypothetical protein